MDDLIFKGKTKEELRRNTLEGLEILAKHDLYIKESKCYWEVEEVPVWVILLVKDDFEWNPQK